MKTVVNRNHLNAQLCGEQVDIGNFKRLHNISTVGFLAVNRDGKFKVRLFIRFVPDGVNLHIMNDCD